MTPVEVLARGRRLTETITDWRKIAELAAEFLDAKLTALHQAIDRIDEQADQIFNQVGCLWSAGRIQALRNLEHQRALLDDQRASVAREIRELDALRETLTGETVGGR